MKLEVDAIGIYVRDMKKMVGFYREALGYTIEWDGGCFAGVRMPIRPRHNLSLLHKK